MHPVMSVSMNLSKREKKRRQNLLSNWTLVLNKAINNLHKCLWFGIMENLDRSLEMFRYQSGLDIQQEKRNVNKGYPKPTVDEVEKLKKLMPMDMYLYEYAKQLHDYRYQMFKQQQQEVGTDSREQLAEQEIGTLPAILKGCKNDGKSLQCNQTDPYFEELEKQYAHLYQR